MLADVSDQLWASTCEQETRLTFKTRVFQDSQGVPLSDVSKPAPLPFLWIHTDLSVYLYEPPVTPARLAPAHTQSASCDFHGTVGVLLALLAPLTSIFRDGKGGPAARHAESSARGPHTT